VVKKRKKKIRKADVAEGVADVIINRVALDEIKRIAQDIAIKNAFPKNLDMTELQYWLLLNALKEYLGIRKVPAPFEIKLESEDR